MAQQMTDPFFIIAKKLCSFLNALNLMLYTALIARLVTLQFCLSFLILLSLPPDLSSSESDLKKI